jgi:hypothetical protein
MNKFFLFSSTSFICNQGLQVDDDGKERYVMIATKS